MKLSFLPIFPYVFVVLFLTLSTSTVYGQNQGLSVEVKRIKNIQGKLHYQLLSCPEDVETLWPGLEPLVTAKAEIKQDSLAFNFPMLKDGQYIVRVFQDTNNNAQLDFSDSGIPKEPTGFSNNPSLLLGYPKPTDSCFNYSHDDISKQLIVINLNNKRPRKRRKHR